MDSCSLRHAIKVDIIVFRHTYTSNKEGSSPYSIGYGLCCLVVRTYRHAREAVVSEDAVLHMTVVLQVWLYLHGVMWSLPVEILRLEGTEERDTAIMNTAEELLR